jgi:hypothetical protein
MGETEESGIFYGNVFSPCPHALFANRGSLIVAELFCMGSDLFVKNGAEEPRAEDSHSRHA